MNRPDRGRVARLLGPPAEQEGSVNDPRSNREMGLEWNEKWVYLDASGRPSRVVLWNRYDLVGVFRVDPTGRLEREDLSAGGGWHAEAS